MSKKQSNPTPEQVGAKKPPAPPFSSKTLSDIKMVSLVIELTTHACAKCGNCIAVQAASRQYCEELRKISDVFLNHVNLKDT